MKFTLKRTYEEKGTRGELFDEEGNHVCLMIERPHKRYGGPHPCIDEGTYILERYDSPRHGPNTWQYPESQTPGRDHCQIHIASWPHELEGCQGPGTIRMTGPDGEPGVGHNKVAYDAFMALTKDLSHIVIEIKS